MGIQVTKIGDFKGHQQSVYSIARIDSENFISAGGDGMLVVWNIHQQDGKLIARLPYQLFSLAFDERTRRCAVGTMQGSIYEFDIESVSLLRQWQAHASSVFELGYDTNGRLLSLGKEGTLSRWGSDIQVAESGIKLSTKSLRCLSFQLEETLVGGSEGIVWTVDSESFEVKQSARVSENSVFGIQKIDGVLYCVGRDARLKSWNGEKNLEDLPAHWYSIHALSVSRDGNYLATGSMDKSIKIWQRNPLRLLKVIDHERYAAHKSSVNRIVWLDEHHFISAGDDRMIFLFNIKEQELATE